MRYSIRAGTIFGTPVYLNISLFLVLPLYAFMFGSISFELTGGFPFGFGDSDHSNDVRFLLGGVLAVFFYLAILIHEAGHAWAAKYKSYKVTGITLFFIGGMSEMEHPEDWPRGESEVAISGVMTSAGLGLVLMSSYFLTKTLFDGWTADLAMILLCDFGLFNLFLGAMNALPVLPMDGGVILRDVLRADMGIAKASAVTLLTSRVVALVIIAVGIYWLSWILIIVGLLLFITISPKQLDD
jgi:Zn-dependent protease